MTARGTLSRMTEQAPALRAVQGAAKSVSSLVSNRTSAARLYSLLTAALAGAGAAYLLAPQSSLAVRPLRQKGVSVSKTH